MSDSDWARFEALVARYAPSAPTHARACGLVLSSLLDSQARPDPGPPNWMDWERRKTLQLLRARGSWADRLGSG
jgi:hypothetical protein